jgi:hypothetical protein
LARLPDISSLGVVTNIFHVRHEPPNLGRTAPSVEDAMTSRWSDEAINDDVSSRSRTENALHELLK